MHDRFADWYKVTTSGVDTTLQLQLLERRWKGVENVVKSFERGEQFELVRLLLNMQPKEQAFLQKFRGQFKDADPTFSMQGNHLELSILAGSALVCLLGEGTNEAANSGSLALICACNLSLSENLTWVPTFLREASDHCNARSHALRKRQEFTIPALDTKTAQTAAEEFAQAIPSGDWGGKVMNSAKSAFAVLFKELHAYGKAMGDAVTTLEQEQSLRKEESDVLWWMTSGYSRDLAQPFSEVDKPGACLIAGKELADLVTIPGPLPAKSFLDKVLSTTGSKTFRKAVQLSLAVGATPEAWRRAVAGRPGVNRVQDFCPVFGAILASLTTDRDGDWHAAYKKAYGLDPRVKIGAVELSYQAYRECLLVRAGEFDK